MEHLLKRKKRLIIGMTGFITVTAFVAWFYHRMKRNKEITSPSKTKTISKNEPQKFKPRQNRSLTKEEEAMIINGFKVEYKDNYLSDATLENIIKAVYKFSIYEFYNLTQDARKVRRMPENSGSYHLDLVTNDRLSDIMKENLSKVLNQLNISEESFKAKLENYPTFNFYRKVVWLLQKNFRKSGTKKATLHQSMKILQELTKLYQEKKEDIRKLAAEKKISMAIASLVVHDKIDDEIYQKYSMEYEDIITSLTNIVNKKDEKSAQITEALDTYQEAKEAFFEGIS